MELLHYPTTTDELTELFLRGPLGHLRIETTEIYAEKNLEAAKQLARQIG